MAGLLFIMVTGMLGFVFWVWMLVDYASNEPSSGNDKLVWILVILLAQLLGAIVYFFVRRPQRIASTGR